MRTGDLDNPSKRAKLLQVLKDTGNLSRAADAARVSRQAVYQKMQTDSAFNVLVHEAIEAGVDAVEETYRDRGMHGTKKMVLYLGQPVKVNGKIVYETDYDNQALLRILQARRREIYGEQLKVSVSDTGIPPGAGIDQRIPLVGPGSPCPDLVMPPPTSWSAKVEYHGQSQQSPRPRKRPRKRPSLAKRTRPTGQRRTSRNSGGAGHPVVPAPAHAVGGNQSSSSFIPSKHAPGPA